MNSMRPSWSEYFLGIADAVSRRADCTRRKVGAVIVDSGNMIVSTGYNGAPPGMPGCLSAGACPRGQHFLRLTSGGGLCNCGNPWPCEEYAKPGSSYDTGTGSCIAVHAELNACIRAGARAKDCVLYLTDEPCDGCMRAIQAARIKKVVWHHGILEL